MIQTVLGQIVRPLLSLDTIDGLLTQLAAMLCSLEAEESEDIYLGLGKTGENVDCFCWEVTAL